MSRIEEEGLGLGIFDFLEGIDKNAKLSKDKYQRPTEEFKFNDPRYEVALGASDLDEEEENGGDLDKAKKDKRNKGKERSKGSSGSSSDQEGFDADGFEVEKKKAAKSKASEDDEDIPSD